MAIIVDLQNESDYAPVPGELEFERWVKAALQNSYADLEQTICIVDEPQSRDLNLRFRDKDSPTNVLAFPAESDLLEYDCLGDLVICGPLVEVEAQQQQKTVEAHWAHLVVHGMLHLQGYDHQTDEQATGMEALEIEILDTLGYTNPYNV